MPVDGQSTPVRLAEIVASLSLGIDLGFGQPMEHVLRQCLVALRLAERVGLDQETRVASAKLARKRIAAAPFPVEYVAASGEEIAAPDHSFDCVVSTFTLCTLPEPTLALRQMRRVLKPGGKLFFAEHGLSTDPKVQKWQHRLNRLQNLVCGGCNMNRDIRGLIAQAGFAFDQVDQYYMKGGPKFVGFMTRGIASAA